MIAVQTAFPTRAMEPQAPNELIEECVHWIEANMAAWLTGFVARAAKDARSRGRVRVKKYAEDVRDSSLIGPDGKPVKLPNAYTPIFGRLLREWHPELADFIPLNSSKFDGCVFPARPY